MYVYIQSEPGLRTVGHYDPNGKFVPESDHGSDAEAAARVAELNGGGKAKAPEAPTLRDLFAMGMMPLVVQSSIGAFGGEGDPVSIMHYEDATQWAREARAAYAIADAMLKARAAK